MRNSVRFLVLGAAAALLASPVVGQRPDNQIFPRSIELQRQAAGEQSAGRLIEAAELLETALAAKFNETILEAVGMDAERPAGFADIESLPQKFIVMPPDVAKMKAYIAEHTGL